jgi:antitoxin component of RelBE/YafQ-DinJ toxin-antitoxin module
MKKLCDYLDSDLIQIFLNNESSYTGIPIDVNYADESENGEDQITIEDPDISMRFHTFSQNEIKDIKELD